MITWEKDTRSYNNIECYDMYADGVITHAWLCYDIREKVWQLKASALIPNPLRATRKEAEADAIAWWAERQLEDKP